MTDPSESDRVLIQRTTMELLAAVNASDPIRVLAIWAHNGVLMPPHQASVHGRVAIDEYFRALFSRRTFRFAFTSSEIQVAGDVAFERVTYTVSAWPSEGGAAVHDMGKGLHVYRRQPDATWKLTQDIWNSDLPAASP
jgi:uncharacterized protein (TIGR02246 family)